MDLIITIQPVVTKDLPISPRFTRLNFTYSRSHAFRYERKNTNPTLVRIELTTSALAGVQTTRATAINFAMKRSAPCSAVLRHPPSSWAAVVHWSTLMPKALRLFRKYPIHSFSWPPAQPAPPTNSPNTTHFGSQSRIRLVRKVASMQHSLPVLISVSR